MPRPYWEGAITYPTRISSSWPPGYRQFSSAVPVPVVVWSKMSCSSSFLMKRECQSKPPPEGAGRDAKMTLCCCSRLPRFCLGNRSNAFITRHCSESSRNVAHFWRKAARTITRCSWKWNRCSRRIRPRLLTAAEKEEFEKDLATARRMLRIYGRKVLEENPQRAAAQASN